MLVVEDDDVIRDALRGALIDRCNVVCVATLASARTLLMGIRFDVVLLDLLLRGEHAEELLHSMANEGVPRTPVVVVSASREAARIANGYGLPFVAKPFDIDGILAALDTAIESQATPRIRV